MSESRTAVGSWAIWGVLLAGGQAATLSLMQAGSKVGYTRLPPVGELIVASPRWALVTLLAQALFVVWAAWRRRAALRAALASAQRARVGALVAALALTSAAVSRSPFRYAQEIVLASLIELLQVVTLFLFVAGFPAAGAGRLSAGLARLLGRDQGDAARLPRAGRWHWALAAAVAVASSLLAFFVYQRHPHVPDEVAYLLQARTFASGSLALPLPPVPEAFEAYLMWARDGRWFSVFPPAWPALLALGVLAGVPWLVNPLIGGMNVLLVFALLREICPASTARLATLLFAVSPWNLFLAMSLMSHTSALALALVGAIAVAKLRRAPHVPGWALVGGLSVGLLLLFRPLEAVIVGVVLGSWSLGAHGARWRFSPSALLALSACAAAALTLPYNRHLMGSATNFPVMAYMDATWGAGSNALGFGANRGAGWIQSDPLPGHGPIDAAINANLNLASIQLDLFGWATGSLLALLFLLFLGTLRRLDRQMLLVFGIVAGFHSLYWFSGGADFGARYWYLAIVPFVVLTARGIETIAERAGAALAFGRERVFAALALLICASLALFVPWRAIDKYRHYRGMRPELRELARDRPWRDALVLVRGWSHPDYSSAVVYNPLDLAAAAPVFVWDRGGVRARLARAFPTRRYWMVDGPTVTGAGYRVVAGPLDAEALLALPDTESWP